MKINLIFSTALSLLLLFPLVISGQAFQRIYGTNLNNSFSKVIPDGSDYYVLGQNEPSNGVSPHATVTRLDANGIHQWTLSLNQPSVWNDAVLTPSGDLLVVGSTLPFDATNKSLMGLVTSSSGGNFTWVRTYDVPGREMNSKIIRSPMPQNPSFPYYVLGIQFEPNANPLWDDIILMNINDTGTFNWKKKFVSVADDEFGRDLEVLPNGDLLISGNRGAQGVMYQADNTGALLNGVTPSGISFSYADASPSANGGFYAVGGTFPGFTAYLMKYDNNLFSVWDARISGLTSISQVWEGSSNGKIYVTGRGIFNGLNRAVILRFTEIANAPSLDWIKFFDNGESSYTGGSTLGLSSGQIAFSDGRTPATGGFGQACAFMSVSDLDLVTCITVESSTAVERIAFLYDAPLLPPIEFFDFPTGRNINSSALNWQQEYVCDNTPCQADFTFQVSCGVVSFTDLSNVPGTPSWQWTFPGGNPSSSTVQNPVVTYLGCGPYDVCLTVSGAGGGSSCSVTVCKTVTIADNTPPVAVCVPSFGVVLDSNCQFVVTPLMIDGGSYDNCQIQSMSVSPSVLSGCGVFPVTLTVTDWCGNTSTCVTNIQTIENVPPVIVCPASVVVTATSPSPCRAVVNGLSPLSVTDHCGTPTVDYVITGATSYSGQNDASGLTFNQGVSTITYTATDECGNTASCALEVIVSCLPSCDTFSIILNTGWDNQTSSKITPVGIDLDASPDLDWIVTADPLNPPPPGGRPADVCGTYGAGWAQPFTNSEWIAASPTRYELQLNNPPYLFKNEINFNLPSGYSFPKIDLQLRADELIHTVYLNNNLIYQFFPPHVDGGFNGPPLNIFNNTAAFFHPGQNKLSISYSDETGGVTGFNLRGEVTYCKDTSQSDSCCADYDLFCQNVINAVSISSDNTQCKATVSIGNLPECDYLEEINWGDGSFNVGPLNSGDMQMHNYAVSGTYIITYLAIELDSNGLICFEKQLQDTIQLDCNKICLNNLVMNPSFETYTSCPTGVSPPFTAASWMLPTDGSADYYNTCATSRSGVSVPNNTFGSQTPRTGSGYAGFILQPVNLYREYLEVPLSSPLISGNTYQVSFYVSLADQARWAIDKFGAYLSIGAIGPITGAPVLSLTPQIANPLGNFITDKTGWTLVSGTYLASGGENYLTIGNFYDNNSTTPVMGLGGFYQGSYYYIDDVEVCASCVTPPCDSCCTDSLEFEALINQGFSVVHHGCSATVTAPQFDSCYLFGSPPYVVGGSPVPSVITDPGGSWTFTFSTSGTYQICVTVFDGCQGKQMCTSVTVDCGNGCQCGTFSDMAIRFERGPGQPLTCGGPPVVLTCPPPGYSYTISGKFECQGLACPPTAPFEAQIEEPNGTITTISNQMANPYFGIPISNLYFQQAGLYTVTLTGHCGSETCKCVLQFIIRDPCPDPCPCSLPDIQAFSQAVNQGFASVLSTKSCKACFTPIALGDCETVEWYVTNTNGSPIGTSTSNHSFCYTFSGSGTYTIIMVATRKKQDGTNCETFVKSQTVTITCLSKDECVASVFDNPSFGEGAVAGGLYFEGHSNGWKANSGNPKLLEGQFESFDGWTMLLSGNLDTADVLTSTESICLEKGTGTLRTTVKSSKSNSSERIPGSTLRVLLGKGWSFPVTWRELNACLDINCFELASVQLPVEDSAEWMDIQIPYDLSNWKAFDICGGVMVRPYIYITNPFSNDQGGEQSYSSVQLDNFCFSGQLATVTEPAPEMKTRIYPNPNTGDFTVELSEPAKQGMTMVIINIAGQKLLEKKVATGNAIQVIGAKDLADGMYLLEIVLDNRLLSVNKFVKQ